MNHMSNKREYPQVNKPLRQYYEQDFMILLLHVVLKGWMTENQVAKLLGLSRQSLNARVNRYKLENEMEEEEEERTDEDDDSSEELMDDLALSELHPGGY